MKNIGKIGLISLIGLMGLTSCSKKQETVYRTDQLITNWRFAHMRLVNAEDSIYGVIPEEIEDITIPHDWAISGPFDRSNDLQDVAVVQNGEKTATVKTGRSGGLPWMGRGWYETRIPTPDRDKCYTLLFDGAMSHAQVCVNGKEVIRWPYGYNAFYADITPYVDSDTSIIVVTLENKPQSSRWYPGAGLYRNVHLITTNKTHVPVWGTHITTPEVSEDKALVHIDVQVEGPKENVLVLTTLYYGDEPVASTEHARGTMEVKNPKLWSPEEPNLYRAVTLLMRDDKIIDQYTTRFGIRSICYTPEHGFQLNGRTRKFKGVCLHHDLGPLGAAVHKDALRHQLSMLKNMGCDAIRTSHNMPASELVELCEEMGFMMMVEPFDVWDWGKTDNDYHVHFNEWAEKDITNMVLHFRNSPAVVMWSSGNEVWNQTFPKGYETVEQLQAIFHRLDPTRPVTCGMDQAKTVIYNGFAAAVELPGFNYRTGRYLEAYEHLPQKMLLGSETASTVSSRGIYKVPAIIQPDAMYADGQCSGYDVEYCAWSGLPEQDFELQDDYSWTLGQFVWTGFDYLGEPSPYDTDAWPSHSSYFGIIDLASLPKDRYWLYRSQWNQDEPTLHLLPHWNWQDGQHVPVFCYTSYPAAELFVNGKSQGKLRFATREEAARMAAGEQIEGVSAMPRVGTFTIPDWGTAPRPELLPRYRLMWQDVPFEAGELKVVAYDAEGNIAAEEVVRTAGVPHHLEVEWANQDEGAEELAYLTVSVRDEQGNLCPNADALIHIDTNGCTFVATANGDARSLDPFEEPHMHAFAGQCTFIVRGHGTATLSSDGLLTANIRL